MFDSLVVLFISAAYLGLLFLLGLRVERRLTSTGFCLADNPYTYSLSLAVYCTAWTYYGSVGSAAVFGPLYLTIYLGPTMAICLAWVVVRRMIRLKREHRITSLADFLSARYGKSQCVAALASVVALLGTVPYIALQLESIIDTFSILTKPLTRASGILEGAVGPVLVGLIICFTIIFGVRRLDPTERHKGMIVMVAVMSVVKLVALLAVGIFVTYVMYDGFADIFVQAETAQLYHPLESAPGASYVQWTSYMILGVAAILFLPRQFHVTVVENSDERHLLTAMWMFPLYLLLINVFVLPIAMAGLLSGMKIPEADFFVLTLPLSAGKPLLALLAFVGGLSAAMSMIMVTAMTMSVMTTNHLLMPLLESVRPLSFLRRHILLLRWVVVAMFILMSYAFHLSIGTSYTLVNIGIFSFAGVLQLAPAGLGGLFWKRANRTGALLGMAAGFAVWFYTLILPSFVKSGWLPSSLLVDGPWGVSWLMPEALLGVRGLDPISHAVFWSLLLNVGLFAAGSIFSKDQPEKDAFPEQDDIHRAQGRVCTLVSKAGKLALYRNLLESYFPPDQVETVLAEILAELDLDQREDISILQLAELHSHLEKILAGALGSAAAHKAMRSADVFSPEEMAELKQSLQELLTELNVSPQELQERINFYQEREALLTAHSEELLRLNQELEQRVTDRTAKLQEAIDDLESFSYSVSHDLWAPLRAIDGYGQALVEDYRDKLDNQGRSYLDRVVRAANRMGEIIDDLLHLSRVSRTDMRQEAVDMSRMAETVVEALRERDPDRRVEVSVQPGLTADGDPRLVRVLLENLLGNAWKFTARTGSARIEFGVEAVDGTEAFYVRDNGAGFDMAFAGKLFKAFNRLHTEDQFAGTGIGLAIVHRVVRRHGGAVWGDGEPDNGAVFHFTLHEA